ncbi:PorT family protein [Nonlabens sp. Ci31]|uniref:type IX secretion/gliding motility protein PorT/SprT n=1 Tax=Nonlabens sp. Ci31 TaxID=2608253 RepID=UPI0014648AD9|nr:porin family protein [Nonlabens sp. Ci31]QJP34250.1 PorT family protein [Nonlabens sp. Ci31]
MRHLMVIIVVAMGFQTANAQLFSKEKIKNLENFDQKTLTWGYYLGFNSYDYKFDYNEITEDIITESSAGFNVGLIGDLRLNDYFNLRLEPGIVFATRNLTFPDPSLTTVAQMEREVTSTYIHIPLLVKFSTKRSNNWKPFIVAGASWSNNLSSNQDNPDDNSAGQFRQTSSVFNYELGIGIDLYLFYFKFSPSIRGVFAMGDELVRDADPNSAWTSNITSMQSRGLFINFTFQ